MCLVMCVAAAKRGVPLEAAPAALDELLAQLSSAEQLVVRYTGPGKHPSWLLHACVHGLAG